MEIEKSLKNKRNSECRPKDLENLLMCLILRNHKNPFELWVTVSIRQY